MDNIPALEKESTLVKTIPGLTANIRINHLISILTDPSNVNNTDFLYYNKGCNRWEIRREIKNGNDT